MGWDSHLPLYSLSRGQCWGSQGVSERSISLFSASLLGVSLCSNPKQAPFLKVSLFQACDASKCDNVWEGGSVSDAALAQLSVTWACSIKQWHNNASLESSPSWNIRLKRQHCSTGSGLSRLCSWKSCSIIDKGPTDITRRQWGSCFPLIISYSADLSFAQQNQQCTHISWNTVCTIGREDSVQLFCS